MSNKKNFTVSASTAALLECVRDTNKLYKAIGAALAMQPDHVDDWQSLLESKYLDAFNQIRAMLGVDIGDNVNNNLFDPENTII